MTNAPSLRLCTQADAAALSLVGAATFLETYAQEIAGSDIVPHCADHHSAAVYDRYLGNPLSRCWLAETAKFAAPIGYQVMAPSGLLSQSPDDIELVRIYLLAPYQGTGLAQRMIGAATDQARTMGKKRLLLGVYTRNDRAVAFYTKMGFERVGEYPFTVGSRHFVDWVFALSLV